jgi:hypothetical protein
MDDKKLVFYMHSHSARVSKSKASQAQGWQIYPIFVVNASYNPYSGELFPPKARFTVKKKSSMKGINHWVRLKVVAFDRSPFKIFTLRFSDKSVPAPSCERGLKQLSEPCFLSFEINNCLAATHFSHHTLN